MHGGLAGGLLSLARGFLVLDVGRAPTATAAAAATTAALRMWFGGLVPVSLAPGATLGSAGRIHEGVRRLRRGLRANGRDRRRRLGGRRGDFACLPR
ncbi:MAG TPA: hypothetical protein VFH93_13725 [Thermoleophilia bacterium]|nr:hypothetical protein [Thermoleophilia bacterium]